MSKPASALSFKPAPRPVTRNVTAEQVEALQDATADLGFTRPSSPPEATPRAKPLTPPRPSITPPVKATGEGEVSSLRFDIPLELSTTLKIDAANRRVTVRYLVLEALAKQGYDVDLSAIPEDGRRKR